MNAAIKKIQDSKEENVVQVDSRKIVVKSGNNNAQISVARQSKAINGKINKKTGTKILTASAKKPNGRSSLVRSKMFVCCPWLRKANFRKSG